MFDIPSDVAGGTQECGDLTNHEKKYFGYMRHSYQFHIKRFLRYDVAMGAETEGEDLYSEEICSGISGSSSAAMSDQCRNDCSCVSARK